MALFPITSLFDAGGQGEPVRICSMKFTPQKREMGLPYGENVIILTSAVFD